MRFYFKSQNMSLFEKIEDFCRKANIALSLRLIAA